MIRKIATIAGITLLTMYALNQAAARSVTARNIIRNNPLSLVNPANTVGEI